MTISRYTRISSNTSVRGGPYRGQLPSFTSKDSRARGGYHAPYCRPSDRLETPWGLRLSPTSWWPLALMRQSAGCQATQPLQRRGHQVWLPPVFAVHPFRNFSDCATCNAYHDNLPRCAMTIYEIQDACCSGLRCAGAADLSFDHHHTSMRLILLAAAAREFPRQPGRLYKKATLGINSFWNPS